MYWYKKLYFGDNAIEKSKEIMRSLKKNEPCFGIYLVVISNMPGNLLDILEWHGLPPQSDKRIIMQLL